MNLGRQYKTYIMADAPFRMKPGDLSQFYIRDPLGNMVPISTLAIVRDTVGPLYTNRFNLISFCRNFRFACTRIFIFTGPGCPG